MKQKLAVMTVILGVLSFSGSLLVAWSAVPVTTHSRSGTNGAAEQGQSRLAAMEKEQARIKKRLEISAPLEIDLVNGVDPVIEAEEKGIIEEATLEEVEAALNAAAATPGSEDDKEAMSLRHRGSYRFFTDPK